MHPPSVFVAGWAMSGESRSAGILGAHKILAELLCPARSISRNSLAATPSRSDFIYTEMAARRRFEFYLHRDGCAAAIRVLSTQRSVRRGDLIVMDLYLHRDGCAAENSVLSTQRMLRRGNLRLR